ncbi:hypothetical protein MJT46_016239 [Ovis ammon polii x Ovis aries]|nr:hypothetical protein MJT46_016239 [Ovis ammon polii x Ovis aries]
MGTPGILSRKSSEKIFHLELRGGNGAPLYVGGTLVRLSTGDGCSRLTTGSSGTRSGGLRKGQTPCELLRGFSGFLSLRCRGLRPCVQSGPEPEDSSPVLTWILGYFWSLARGVLLTYDGDLSDPLGSLRKVQSPFELLGGLSGFLSIRCQSLRSCVELGPEPEDSSSAVVDLGVLR